MSVSVKLYSFFLFFVLLYGSSPLFGQGANESIPVTKEIVAEENAQQKRLVNNTYRTRSNVSLIIASLALLSSVGCFFYLKKQLGTLKKNETEFANEALKNKKDKPVEITELFGSKEQLDDYIRAFIKQEIEINQAKDTLLEKSLAIHSSFPPVEPTKLYAREANSNSVIAASKIEHSFLEGKTIYLLTLASPSSTMADIEVDLQHKSVNDYILSRDIEMLKPICEIITTVSSTSHATKIANLKKGSAVKQHNGDWLVTKPIQLEIT